MTIPTTAGGKPVLTCSRPPPEELEEPLRSGAWDEAFGQWAGPTDLNESEVEITADLGLFREFDFWQNLY